MKRFPKPEFLDEEFAIDEFLVNDKNVNNITDEMEFLGEGSSRTVYAINDELVLKVPNCISGDYNGRTHNKREASIYQHASDEHKKYLAAVIACSKTGKWSVMERVNYTCECDDDYDVRSMNSILVRECTSAIANCISGYVTTLDLHSSNVGITCDGKFKVVDYAGV